MKQFKYFTVAELTEQALAEAKKDPLWEECSGKYKFSIEADKMVSRLPIPSLAFRLMSVVSFSGRDALGSVALDYDGKQTHLLNVRVRNTGKEAYLAAHQIVGLVCYHANEIVKANRNRFERGGYKSESYCHI